MEKGRFDNPNFYKKPEGEGDKKSEFEPGKTRVNVHTKRGGHVQDKQGTFLSWVAGGTWAHVKTDDGELHTVNRINLTLIKESKEQPQDTAPTPVKNRLPKPILIQRKKGSVEPAKDPREKK